MCTGSAVSSTVLPVSVSNASPFLMDISTHFVRDRYAIALSKFGPAASQAMLRGLSGSSPRDPTVESVLVLSGPRSHRDGGTSAIYTTM